MDTAFFRFVQRDEYKQDIYNTASSSVITSTVVFTLLMLAFNRPIAALIGIKEHAEYITLAAFIIALDALAALPFARLRQEGRPKKFAFVRIGGILIYIGVIYFFLSLCPAMLKKNSNSPLLLIYNENFGVGYILLANVLQNLFQVVVLYKELFGFKPVFRFQLWKHIMVYALPLAVANFAGTINETFDRVMLNWWSPAATHLEKLAQVGTYSACYKLSILISLFVQAFRMGAEPFFFGQSNKEDAPKTYARVMKFFVIIITVMFLVVALYLDIWKHFIQNKKMWAGLTVVPILLFANMFLGIYYNLSIWYKLSHRTSAGAYITFIGVGITLVVNYLFIPRFGYMACAWATFLCYGSMMVVSFVWGQKHYRIPYAWKKLVAYLVIVALLYFIHHAFTAWWPQTWFSYVLATAFLAAYSLFILRIERKEFRKLPVVGKYI
jgi:O-antigen/teichoic acid export membrane protein